MMSTHSHTASPGPSPRPDHQTNGSSRVRVEGGSGSDSDWTGTGDDWTGTGTSSDSAFFSYIRGRHQMEHSSRFTSPGHASPSPPPPRSSSQGEGIYTVLDPLTLNTDSNYCSIDRLQPRAVDTLRPSPSKSLGPVAELEESDEYCKMVPNTGIRAALLRQDFTGVMTSPVLGHRHPLLVQTPSPGHRPGQTPLPLPPPHRNIPPRPVPKHNSLGEIYTPRE